MSSNKQIIDWPASVAQSNGDEAFTHKLFDMFVKKLPEYKEKIIQTYNDKDYQGLFDEVHAVNGSTCYVSTPNLREKIRALEAAIKRKQQKLIDELVIDVTEQIDKVIDVYEKEIQH